MSDITQILQAVKMGEDAGERLWPMVYDELRKLAAHKLSSEAAGHTLQATALVHEAWLRLGGGKIGQAAQSWENRAHFFSAAAQAMRRILIDSARRKETQKRIPGEQRVDLNDVDVAAKADDTVLLRIDAALENLEREDPRSAELVKLRFFIGLSFHEASAALGVSERTAKRLWEFARAWMFRELKRDEAV